MNRVVRLVGTLLVAVFVWACPTDTVNAAPVVRLHATLTPEHLGQATTVGFGFQIITTTDQAPSPLVSVDIRYPGNLGIALSGLGVATCSLGNLEAHELQGCPRDSRMGYGTATAEIPIGPEHIYETANIVIVRAPVYKEHLALLFYAEGEVPVFTQLVFPGLLLPAFAPFGGDINIDIPLVPALPEGPDVAIVKLHATLGPQHLTYYEHINGRTIPYNPKGIVLPDTCPHGGFPFAAELAFLNGSHASAHTTVPCPHR